MTDVADKPGPSPAEHGCRMFRVTGRVQGVFFRASAQTAARDLGLGGYARNLADGSVEVLACGNLAAVQQFQEWLGDGPPMAEVADVSELHCDAEPRDEFVIA